MSIHEFSVTSATGEQVLLGDYSGRVLLIVNTASKCGHTPQYTGLQTLQDTYAEQGFTVLGFPCNQFKGQEPGSDAEIQEFCSMNYGVTFPVMAKVDVNGENADPLYAYLTQEHGGPIDWNFAKFLVDANGNVQQRFAPGDQPETIEPAIRNLLGVSV